MEDHVIPDVPVRQSGVPDARTVRVGVEWVLTLPQRIRYVLAWRHDLCKAVVRVLLREVQRHLRTRARARGLAEVRGRRRGDSSAVRAVAGVCA